MSHKVSNRFCIDITFEMRTVHCKILLLIDVHQIVRQDFITNGYGGEESKIAERQRERVFVRQSVGGKGEIASLIK